MKPPAVDIFSAYYCSNLGYGWSGANGQVFSYDMKKLSETMQLRMKLCTLI
jgi:hypothetical protein